MDSDYVIQNFGTDCCPHVLIICGKSSICADEEPRDEKKKT
jgi:hypothetical protein